MAGSDNMSLFIDVEGKLPKLEHRLLLRLVGCQPRHERQAFDKPQRRKPRNAVLTLRMLWGLWRWHRVLSNHH